MPLILTALGRYSAELARGIDARACQQNSLALSDALVSIKPLAN